MSFVPSSQVKKEDKKNKKQQPTAKPVTQDEDYCAELDGRKMDFSYLENEQFIVGVSTGDRNKPKILGSTIRGPFDFYRMVEAVGMMYQNEQHHAKVYMLKDSFDEGTFFLDEGTIDYIEAYWQDILTDGLLEEAIFGEDEEVVSAGSVDVEYNEESKDGK